MESDTLKALVQAVLVTSSTIVSIDDIVTFVDSPEITHDVVEATLETLAAEWAVASSGLRLERVGGGWRCVTPPELDPYLRAYHGLMQRARLSQAALEVLSIVAHRQPVTQPEINFIRGANSTAVLRTLLDRRLIRVAGRKNVVGKPFLYRTGKEFLLHFGLDRIEELPAPEELSADASGPSP